MQSAASAADLKAAIHPYCCWFADQRGLSDHCGRRYFFACPWTCRGLKQAMRHPTELSGAEMACEGLLTGKNVSTQCRSAEHARTRVEGQVRSCSWFKCRAPPMTVRERSYWTGSRTLGSAEYKGSTFAQPCLDLRAGVSPGGQLQACSQKAARSFCARRNCAVVALRDRPNLYQRLGRGIGNSKLALRQHVLADSARQTGRRYKKDEGEAKNIRHASRREWASSCSTRQIGPRALMAGVR